MSDFIEKAENQIAILTNDLKYHNGKVAEIKFKLQVMKLAMKSIQQVEGGKNAL